VGWTSVGISVGIVTVLRAGRCGVRVSAGWSYAYLLQNRLDRLWSPHSLLFSVYQGSFRIVKLTVYPHLAPRLGVNGAGPLLPQYAFMAWTGTSLCWLVIRLWMMTRKKLKAGLL